MLISYYKSNNQMKFHNDGKSICKIMAAQIWVKMSILLSFYFTIISNTIIFMLPTTITIRYQSI